MNRNAPTLPPVEGMDDDSELVTETALGAPKPWAVPTLDSDTRELISDTIAKAIAAELGRVQITSIAPGAPSKPTKPSEPEPPRSSMRAAAKGAGQVGKWGVFASGAVTIVTSLMVWLMRPEYAAPLGQALKLIAAVILAAAGGGAPAQEAPPARDVPAIALPAPSPPRPPDVAP